jgi:mRNA interferase HicA
VKKRDLEQELKKLGWWFKRHGSNHDIWTDGEAEEAVPRHREINEILARSILKMAIKTNKGKINENSRKSMEK